MGTVKALGSWVGGYCGGAGDAWMGNSGPAWRLGVVIT